MIYKIKGILSKKSKNSVIIENNGFFYQIDIPQATQAQLKTMGQPVELILYHYLNITKSKGIPVLIGFLDELEKDFFEKFITVSGIGPKAALRAFDKPIPLIAKAIEKSDIGFLTSLAGVGKQKARQIIAHLQGKVGRFALLKEETPKEKPQDSITKEIIREGRQVLRRLQYKTQEIEQMIENAFKLKPEIENVETLLNEIYKQKGKTKKSNG